MVNTISASQGCLNLTWTINRLKPWSYHVSILRMSERHLDIKQAQNMVNTMSWSVPCKHLEMSKRHLNNKQALTKAKAQTMVNTMPTSHQMPSIIIDINNKHHCHCNIWSLTDKCSNHGHTYHVNI